MFFMLSVARRGAQPSPREMTYDSFLLGSPVQGELSPKATEGLPFLLRTIKTCVQRHFTRPAGRTLGSLVQRELSPKATEGLPSPSNTIKTCAQRIFHTSAGVFHFTAQQYRSFRSSSYTSCRCRRDRDHCGLLFYRTSRAPWLRARRCRRELR